MEPTNGNYKIVSYTVCITPQGADYIPSGTLCRDTLAAARKCQREQSKVHGCASDIIDSLTGEYRQ